MNTLPIPKRIIPRYSCFLACITGMVFCLAAGSIAKSAGTGSDIAGTGLDITGTGIYATMAHHGLPAGSIRVTLHEDGEEVEIPSALEDALNGPLKNGHSDADDAVREILARHYASNGHFSAQIDSLVFQGMGFSGDNELYNKMDVPENSGTLRETESSQDEESPRLLIFSNPGCRFTIGTIDYRLTDNDPDLLDGFIAFYAEGDVYDAAALEAELRRLVRHFESQGFPLAEIAVTDFRPDSNSCELSLSVEITSGEELYAAGVWTDGLSQHNPDYIETASGIRKDDRITPDLFDRGRRNLENTGFFHDVSDGDIVIRDGEPYVYFDVTERRANNFDLMFGYVPEQVDGYNVVGHGKMRVRNVGWAGSTMNLTFERLENLVTRMKAGYERQWIGGLPAGAGMHFGFLQQDTTYQVRELQVESSWNWTPERKISLHLIQENTSVNTSPDLAVRVLDGITRSAGFGFHYENTDSRLSPTRGMIYHLYVASGFRRVTDSRAEELESQGTMMQQRVRSSLQTFYSPFLRQVVALRIFGSLVESPEYTETDLFRLGGSQSLRGYREEQFRVARTAWSDLEYRYLLDAYSHAFLFAAGGIYDRPRMLGDDQDGATEWLRSGGFGFRYRTPIGIMQFTYAVSADDPLHNGKVHFSLSAEF